MKTPESCGWSISAYGMYLCSLSLAPCERVEKCPEERDAFKELKETKEEG